MWRTRIGIGVLVSAWLLAGAVAASSSQGDPIPPAEFSGTLGFGYCDGVRSAEWADKVARTRSAALGQSCKPRVIVPFDDPRLQGEIVLWRNWDRHIDGPTVTYSNFTIEDDTGAWHQIPGVSLHFPDRSHSVVTYVFEGRGAYDGLLAIAEIALEADVWTWHGWIIDSDLPPVPTAP